MSGSATPAQQTQSTSSSSNSSSTTGPNSVIGPTLGSIAGGLSSYLANNPLAPGYYPGSTVAPQSPATISALQSLFQRGANGSPVVNSADAAVTAAMDPSRLNLSSNPNFQNAVSAYVQPLNQQFANQVLPGIAGEFEGTGRFGPGNASQSATNQAVAQLTQSEANATSGMANTAYQQAQQNQLQAASLAPTLANQDYQNIAAMEQAGQAEDQYAQANTDAAVARYNANAMAQPNYWTTIAQMLQSIYPGGTTSGSSSSSGNSYGYSTPSSNPTSGLLGAIMGGAGLALQAAPLLGGSDVRLKKNIRPIGKTNSGHNLYSYEFLGSSKPEIGVLAQEVEQKDPAAVVTHPSGYKMVDYNRIATMPVGGLL
jgi:hypothetical protein